MQYQETDFAFVSRLLEEAGIAYFFKHEGETGKGQQITKVVFHDKPHTEKPIPDSRSFPYRGTEDGLANTTEESITSVGLAQKVAPGKLTVGDYDFRLKPDLPLWADSTAEAPESLLEHYRYEPGAFWLEPGQGGGTPAADDKGVARTDMKEAEARAERELSALRNDRVTVSFRTVALDLAPGIVMAIGQGGGPTDQHPSPQLKSDKKLLVVRRRIAGKANGSWVATIDAVPAALPYRPSRRTPKPKVTGIQSALVVGPKGQEIHTDEFGRVRVQFHWDREGKSDDNSSCWIRVSQGWAGGGFGIIAIPRIGHEVLVDFFEGDPDRPVVVGRVYNSTDQVPYKLPDEATKSGWKSDSSPKGPDGDGGFNELMFDDAKGKELIHLQAEKNLTEIIKGDHTSNIFKSRSTTIGTTDTIQVANKHAVTVGGGSTGLLMTSGQLVLLTTGQASLELTKNNLHLNALGEIHIHAGSKIHISSSGNIVIDGGPLVTMNDGHPPTPDTTKVPPAHPPTGGASSGPHVIPPKRQKPVTLPGSFDDVKLGSGDPESPARPKAASGLAGALGGGKGGLGGLAAAATSAVSTLGGAASAFQGLRQVLSSTTGGVAALAQQAARATSLVSGVSGLGSYFNAATNAMHIDPSQALGSQAVSFAREMASAASPLASMLPQSLTPAGFVQAALGHEAGAAMSAIQMATQLQSGGMQGLVSAGLSRLASEGGAKAVAAAFGSGSIVGAAAAAPIAAQAASYAQKFGRSLGL